MLRENSGSGARALQTLYGSLIYKATSPCSRHVTMFIKDVKDLFNVNFIFCFVGQPEIFGHFGGMLGSDNNLITFGVYLGQLKKFGHFRGILGSEEDLITFRVYR